MTLAWRDNALILTQATTVQLMVHPIDGNGKGGWSCPPMGKGGGPVMQTATISWMREGIVNRILGMQLLSQQATTGGDSIH